MGTPVILNLRTNITTFGLSGEENKEVMTIQREGEVVGLTKGSISVRKAGETGERRIWFSGRMVEKIIILEDKGQFKDESTKQ